MGDSLLGRTSSLGIWGGGGNRACCVLRSRLRTRRVPQPGLQPAPARSLSLWTRKTIRQIQPLHAALEKDYIDMRKVLEKFKINDIKAILRVYKLKVVGKKSILVDRLADAAENNSAIRAFILEQVAEEERRNQMDAVAAGDLNMSQVALSLVPEESKELARMERDLPAADQFQPMTSLQKDVLVGVAIKLSLDDLKSILRSIQLPTSGAKSRVVARVISAAETNKRVQQRLLNLAGMNPYSLVVQAVEDAPSDLEKELPPNTSVSQLTMDEIKENLSELGLPTSGCKSELVMRLLVAQKESGGNERRTPQEEEMHHELMKVEGMTKVKLLDYMAKRGQIIASASSHMSVLDACKRWILSHYYGIGVRVKRQDFEGLLNRQLETQNLIHFTRSEVTQRAKAIGIATRDRSREELIEVLKEARKATFPITDVANIRIDALAQEWFLQTFQQCREDTFHGKIPQLNVSEVQAELKKRGVNIDGEEDELRSVLLSVVSIELGLSQKALGDVATSLIDRVHALHISQLQKILDCTVPIKPKVIREGRDVLLFSLVPRLLQIFDREAAIEKHTRQEITDLKYNRSWEVDGVQHGSVDEPATICVLFEQDPAGASLSSVLCLLDHLQTRKYHEGENAENLAPKDIELQGQSGIQIFPYLLDDNQQVHRLTAANVFQMNTCSMSRQTIPEDAVLVGDLQDWAKEIREVDAVLPLLHGPLGSDGSLIESLSALEISSTDDPTVAESMEKSCIGNCKNLAGELMSRHRMIEILREKGFPAVPSFVMSSDDLEKPEAWYKSFCMWCARNHSNFANSNFVIRPTFGYGTLGNSKLVSWRDCVQEAQRQLSEEGVDQVMIQKPIPAEDGAEFNCWVVDTKNGPHALLPTEVEYPAAELVRPLSSNRRYHTPPKMDFVKIQSIRKVAEAAFRALGLRDFACIHGVAVMDNDRTSREKKVVPHLPQPIPSDMYQEQLGPEDVHPGLLDSCNNAWNEHASDLDEAIEAWDPEGEDPEVTKFREWLSGICSETDMDPTLLTDPRPEFRALRERRPPAIIEDDFSEVEEFAKFLGDTEKASLEDTFQSEEFTIAITDVEFGLRLDQTNTLFQQAACIGLSQASILRHFVNLTLSRRGREPIQSLQEKTTSFSPDVNAAFAEVDPKDAQGQDEGDDYEELAGKDIDQEYYGRTYGMDDTEVESSMEALSQALAERPTSTDNDTKDDAQSDGTQQIWVLSGGNGPGQQASFQSGKNAWQKLRRPGDLQVYHAVLVPDEYEAGKCERLAALLERRRSFLEEGVEEEAINTYRELSLEYMRNPDAPPTDLDWQQVIVLDPVAALAPTIDDALENANRRILATNTAPHIRDTEMVGLLQSEALCRDEFIRADVEGVCGLWGGEISPCPLSVTTNLDIFSGRAAGLGAIIHLSVLGGSGEDGSIQEMLEQKNVLYSGSGVAAAQMCIDKAATQTHINSQGDGTSALFAIDSEVLSAEEFMRTSNSLDECEVLFKNACSKHGVSALVIKDNNGVLGSCVAKIRCGRDLQVFGQALREGWPRIENEVLSGFHSPVVTLCNGISKLVLEPYIDTGPYEWRENGLECTGVSEWILVTVGLLGGLGEMRALVPSLNVRPVEAMYDVEQKLLYAKDEHVTPVPESICEPAILQSCQKYIQKVGDILGLSGAAQVDAFLNRRTGEVGIVDVNTSPYLGPNSPLLQQGALEPVPLYPDDLCRELVIIAATPFSVEGSYEEDLVGFFEESDSMPLGSSPTAQEIHDA